MGQSQSQSSGGSNTAASAPEAKTSYYVLLGVERTATEDEIKKAYRRKALELHPDRNYGNEEAATKLFAEIQSAHEVLSDPQERAWYDSHESAILRGDDGGDADAPTYEDVRVTTADDLARMVSKFNRNVEFSDAPSGFFGYVRETFEQLAKEEDIAASWEDVEIRDYPSFGHKDDDYADVVKHFYAAWSNFSTVKSFSWRDKYRLSEAPDRWYRRRMEQENLRLRKEGKQEFNEAVRSLVAFIRKRDPRFVPNTQTEEERQKVLRDAAAAQAARARAANAAKLEAEIPEWTKVRDEEELEESEEEEVEEEILECVACNKTFKSEKQWEAHEKSKKHQKAVKSLQHKMRKQNAHLGLDESGTESGVATPDLDEEEEEEVLDDLAAEVEDHEAHVDEESEETPEDSKKHTQNDETSSEAEEENAEPTETKDTASKHEKLAEQSGEEEPSNSEDEDYASRETIQARMQSMSLDTPDTGSNEDESQPNKPKMGKAAQKRAKKAAAAAAGQQTEPGHKCEVCNDEFSSKTKLFQHIKDEGHAALKTVTGGNGGAKSKKGKGKR